MKIAFHDPCHLDYTPDTPLRQPLGGTQSAVSYLAAALAARGHQVTLYNRSSELGLIRGVNVVGIAQTTPNNLNAHDVVISTTNPCGLKFRRAGVRAPMVMWQHQAAKAPLLRALSTAEERKSWSHFIFVSEHQRDAFFAEYGVQGSVLRNAISPSMLATPPKPECFLDRGDDPVLIYASAPGRGLELLLAAFAAVRERLPMARLQVCSDHGIYQESMDADPFSAIYALARALPGVDFIGSLSQSALGDQYANADILAYPATFLETSCIVAMEAASAGCRFMGTDYGALRETLSGYGDFIPAVDSRALLSKTFAALVIDAVEAARASPDAYKHLRVKQIAHFRETHTWERRASEWENWLQAFLGSATSESAPTDSRSALPGPSRGP